MSLQHVSVHYVPSSESVIDQVLKPATNRAYSRHYPFFGLLWKDKVRPRTGHEGLEREEKYSSTLSLTSTLVGSVWLALRPGRFTLEKETRCPFYRRLGGSQEQSGRVQTIFFPTGDLFFLFALYPYFCVLNVLSFPFCLYCTIQTSMPPTGFEPTIPVSDRPQILALDRSAIGFSRYCPVRSKFLYRLSYPDWIAEAPKMEIICVAWFNLHIVVVIFVFYFVIFFH
jgi:hypothetical protein